MTQETPVVQVRNVSFGYNRAMPVLENASLDIAPDDYLGIVGPNGSGKTTLLRLILGLLTPTRGTVTVFGSAPARVRHRIGYVPQHARVDAEVPATALDVVLMGRLRMAPWSPGIRAPPSRTGHRRDDPCRRRIAREPAPGRDVRRPEAARPDCTGVGRERRAPASRRADFGSRRRGREQP